MLLFVVQAFAIFCGMGINNTSMYETAMKAIAKQRVALEVMSYHAIAPMEEAEKLEVCTVFDYYMNFFNFHENYESASRVGRVFVCAAVILHIHDYSH